MSGSKLDSLNSTIPKPRATRLPLFQQFALLCLSLHIRAATGEKIFPRAVSFYLPPLELSCISDQCQLNAKNIQKVYSAEIFARSAATFLIFDSLAGISQIAIGPADARSAELRHYMQRETDALALAEDVVKQLEGISSLDQKALAEVRCSIRSEF